MEEKMKSLSIFNRLAHNNYKIQSQRPRTTTGSLSFGFEYSSDIKHRYIIHMTSFAPKRINFSLQWETTINNDHPCSKKYQVSHSGPNPPMKTTAGALSLLLESSAGWLTISTNFNAKGQNNHGVFVFWLWIYSCDIKRRYVPHMKSSGPMRKFFSCSEKQQC